eukprot:2765940-Rhodomonas_salina.1
MKLRALILTSVGSPHLPPSSPGPNATHLFADVDSRSSACPLHSRSQRFASPSARAASSGLDLFEAVVEGVEEAEVGADGRLGSGVAVLDGHVPARLRPPVLRPRALQLLLRQVPLRRRHRPLPRSKCT